LLFARRWDDDEDDSLALAALAVTGPVGITGLAPLTAKAPPRQGDNRAEVSRSERASERASADAARATSAKERWFVKRSDASHHHQSSFDN
jgi:hypothetical protein